MKPVAQSKDQTCINTSVIHKAIVELPQEFHILNENLDKSPSAIEDSTRSQTSCDSWF